MSFKEMMRGWDRQETGAEKEVRGVKGAVVDIKNVNKDIQRASEAAMTRNKQRSSNRKNRVIAKCFVKINANKEEWNKERMREQV
jgi:hypothetical protein